MRIAFIQFLYYEYLGVMYLSASLKKGGHSTEVFICPEVRKADRFVDEVVAHRPEVIAFSVMSGNEEIALSMARRIKSQITAYSIFGGPHPTVVPEIIKEDGVDCVCRGESEQSLTAIADVLAAGGVPEKVPGAWFKIEGRVVRNAMGPIIDLDALPHPDRTLYRSKYPALRNRRAGFITGRGCPYQCSFCASPSVARIYAGRGPFVRRRTVQDVLQEIRETVDGYDIRTLYFEDDTFIMNRKWVLEFCDAYRREIGLPFSCHIRADIATEELIAALAAANCRTVSFGVETGNELKRRHLLQKEVTDQQISTCATLLKKYGVRFRTLNILGLPGETLEDSFQTVALNARIKADLPWCSIYQPLPGTEMWEECKNRNLFEDGVATTRASFFKDSPLCLEDKNEIVNLHKLFFYATKFPGLHGVIRIAVRVRPNRGYEIFFALAHAWVYYRSERLAITEVVRVGLMNIARYLSKKVAVASLSGK